MDIDTSLYIDSLIHHLVMLFRITLQYRVQSVIASHVKQIQQVTTTDPINFLENVKWNECKFAE